MVLNNNLITNRKIIPQTVINFYAERYWDPAPAPSPASVETPATAGDCAALGQTRPATGRETAVAAP